MAFRRVTHSSGERIAKHMPQRERRTPSGHSGGNVTSLGLNHEVNVLRSEKKMRVLDQNPILHVSLLFIVGSSK